MDFLFDPSQPISSLRDDDITDALFSLVGANMSLLCLRPAETPPRGTKAAPRRPGPEPRPVSPDWAAAARRTPDLSRRAATFDPGTAQILRTFRDGCGDLFKLVALRPVRRDGTGRPKHAEPVPVLRQEVNRSGRFCLRSNWFWDFLLTFVVKVFTVPTMFCSFSPGPGGAQRSEVRGHQLSQCHH